MENCGNPGRVNVGDKRKELSKFTIIILSMILQLLKVSTIWIMSSTC